MIIIKCVCGEIYHADENFKFLNFRQINSGLIDFVTTLNNEEVLSFLSSKPEILNKNLKLKDFIQNDFKNIRYNWAVLQIY